MSDPNKVWPTGLTEGEAEELHRHIIQGTQIFGMIAALAHLLAYMFSPVAVSAASTLKPQRLPERAAQARQLFCGFTALLCIAQRLANEHKQQQRKARS